MIKTLTPEQEKYLSIVADTWMSIGTSTHPANRIQAENGIELAYKLANRTPPEEIIWCNSPMECMQQLELGKLLRQREILDKYNIQHAIKKSVQSKIHNKVDFRLRSYIGQKLVTKLRNLIAKSIRAAIWDTLLYSMSPQARFRNYGSLRNANWGQHDADWLVSFAYYDRILGLHDEVKPLHGLMDVAKNAGYWLPGSNFCIISERHNRLMLNHEGKLNASDNPVIFYPDNSGVYMVEDFVVPEKLLIAPETITIDEIVYSPSPKARKLMFAKVGLDNLVRNSGVKPFYRDQAGELYNISHTMGGKPLQRPITIARIFNVSHNQDLWQRIPAYYTSSPKNSGPVKIETTAQAMEWLDKHPLDYLTY